MYIYIEVIHLLNVYIEVIHLLNVYKLIGSNAPQLAVLFLTIYMYGSLLTV